MWGMKEKLPGLLVTLFAPTRLKRTLFFLLADIFIIVTAFYTAFYLRFGFTFPDKYVPMARCWLGVILLFTIGLLYAMGLYRINWRFVGLTELLNLLTVALAVTLTLFFANLLVIRPYLPGWDLPRGIIVIEALLGFSMIGILRISKRMYMQFKNGGRVGKKTLIIGADYTGERLIKELISSEHERSYPVVIVDEDPMKIGTRIGGVPVMGGFDRLPAIIQAHKIESILINLPQASHQKIAFLFDLIKPLKVGNIKVVPRVDDYQPYTFQSKNIKQLDIEDLLSRQSVQISPAEIEAYIRDKVVLVTGASGSIGSEIVRQLMNFNAGRIIAFEIDETEVFNLERELKGLKRFGQEIHFVIGDVREKRKLKAVFERYRPQVIFHAAAYKHVPLMEDFPEEAIKTNVFGTLSLVEIALSYGCEKLVNISTDKAVNPSSVMGASKRLAEMICTAYNCRSTPMVSVRFGNVIGSRGSVVPIFLDQIKKGGPIEVTHRDMERYFMSVSEAVLLVLQAAALGNGGEVFALDMGKPVRIIDLAETLIYLNNLVPYRDIDIVFTGLRPGEKLFEEVLMAEEGTLVTSHEKIFVARNHSTFNKKEIDQVFKRMEEALDRPQDVIAILKECVPFYDVAPGPVPRFDPDAGQSPGE